MSKAQPPARTSQSSPASAPRPVINVKFEVIKPPRTPRDKVRYLDVDGPSPVARAEKQLQQMNVAYPMWLEEDRKVLWDAWQALRAKPHDTAAFLRFNHAIHILSGNAALLDCEAAGLLARPVAIMMENCGDVDDCMPLLEMAIKAICTAITRRVSSDDAVVGEIVRTLERAVRRRLAA